MGLLHHPKREGTNGGTEVVELTALRHQVSDSRFGVALKGETFHRMIGEELNQV